MQSSSTWPYPEKMQPYLSNSRCTLPQISGMGLLERCTKTPTLPHTTYVFRGRIDGLRLAIQVIYEAWALCSQV